MDAITNKVVYYKLNKKYYESDEHNVVICNFSGLDETLIKQSFLTIDDLLKKYPQVKLMYISTLEGNHLRVLNSFEWERRYNRNKRKEMRDSLASAFLYPSMGLFEPLYSIELRADKFRNLSQTEHMYKDMANRGIIPSGCGCINGTIAHEFGHVAFWQLIKKDKLLKYKLYLRYLLMRLFHIHFSDQPKIQYKLWQLENITNEFFAEAFSALNYGDKSSKNHHIVKYVKKICDKYLIAQTIDRIENVDL